MFMYTVYLGNVFTRFVNTTVIEKVSNMEALSYDCSGSIIKQMFVYCQYRRDMRSSVSSKEPSAERNL